MLALLASPLLKFVPVSQVTTSIFFYQNFAPSTPTWMRDNLIPGSNLSKQLPRKQVTPPKLQSVHLFGRPNGNPPWRTAISFPMTWPRRCVTPSESKKSLFKQAGITWHKGNTLKLFLQRAYIPYRTKIQHTENLWELTTVTESQTCQTKLPNVVLLLQRLEYSAWHLQPKLQKTTRLPWIL